MPDTQTKSLTDIALATSTNQTLVVSSGPGALPTTPSTLTYNNSTQTLGVGAVAAVPRINHGTQGGTFGNPTPQTLWTHQPADTTSFGPWQTLSAGQFFTYRSSTIWDPVLYLGYNPNRDPSAPGRNDLHTLTYNLEANYQNVADGRLTCEAYVEFQSKFNDGVNRLQRRPWGCTLDQATSSTRFFIELGPPLANYGYFAIVGGVDPGGDFTIAQVTTGTSAATSTCVFSSPTTVNSSFGVLGASTVGSTSAGSAAAQLESTAANGSTPIFAGYASGNLSPVVKIDPAGNLSIQTGVQNTCALTIYDNTDPGNYGAIGFQFGPTTPGAASQLRNYCPTGGYDSDLAIWLSTSATNGPLQERMRIHGATGTVNLTNNLVVGGSLSVGGGATLSKILPASAVLAFPSIAANSQQELTISLTGATAGAMVSLGPPAALAVGLIATARVSAAGVVTVRVSNITGSPITPASATYNVVVFNP